ncbi:uncharacterized protein LOC115715063 isoform X1 [Cannabis sativa]|uniref:uncharacterized protein LOC115715063 isoform X1 n=1 Tax=Cannabis sativa TaxID=3483 RepID=UPI0029CA94A7|nr:uncharacterized protein LOC115715063 isoform X1 [Cannabis sativa]
MPKNMASRRELLDRWRSIEEEEEDDDDGRNNDPSKCRSLHQSKEQWFVDAFSYLMSLPKENHIWCGSWDLMGPLLETFYNYHKDERDDSPLKRLWKRISEEMGQCVQCITQHHQAQEMYNMEYEFSSISPLLDVLRSLDEERVTMHLREINAKLVREDYNPACDNYEVVSVMYEVLMFPILLDDQSLFTEFEQFIEAIDNVHELALDGQQQFPGVYALFFFKRRVRSVGHRLAGSMGKLRRATDVEPLQPLIKKFISFLEAEALPSATKTSRPRAELDRVSIWLGIKSLLGFLEPPAFEEGILERYPIFLDIVLNHISGDSVDFSHAVTCLRLLFEILGCKLWLRSTLSPSVMRNTLLGQCFHSRNEKSHKDIFDLFQPFLQSLEALQDGEHEKQRRHFLYFLLHQVPASSNFSVLTRQKARQISLFIVHRGYAMNPPCPPFECAHMWGPPLVSSLKDSSLHNSLRQPAIDLIQTILVSDAAVLISSLLSSCPPPSPGRGFSNELNDDEDDNIRLLFSEDVEEKYDSSWSDFSKQSKIVSLDFGEWMCIPMLWIDVLADINPLVLPPSFWKAVFWARSRFSMVESELNSELAVPVRTWLLSSEISTTFGWKLPTGSDDGGDVKEQKNSIKVSTMSLSLIRAFIRLTEHFLVQVGHGELRKQWTWEPRMGESLILTLLDSNDAVRQFGKYILEHVSDTKGLACGLKFLCSSGSSLSAVFLGLRHAVKLVQVDAVILKFQMLQHFLFVLRKLLDQGELLNIDMPDKSSDCMSKTKFSTHGGFLRQPVFNSFPASVDEKLIEKDKRLQEKFCCLLSEMAWPCIKRCLIEGKASIGYSICQMTCVRLLEILPVVFERLWPSLIEQSGSCGILKSAVDFSWLHDLVDWGKSSLKVVVVYWKRAVASLLKLLKGSCHNGIALTIKTIEELISCESVSMDELTEQVSRLSVSLSKEASNSIKKSYSSERLFLRMKEPTVDVQPWPIKDTELQLVDSSTINDKKDRYDLIVLSDDEKEDSPSEFMLSDTSTGQCKLDYKTVTSHVHETTSNVGLISDRVCGNDTSKDMLKDSQRADVTDGSASKINSSQLTGKLASVAIPKLGVDNKQKERISTCNIDNSLESHGRVNLKKSSDGAVSFNKSNKACESAKTNDTILQKIVCDTEDDPLESALDSVKRQPSSLAKPNIFVPKRQLIHLSTPNKNNSGHLQRLEARARRFKPPRLDEWYKPILEIDYFATIGLTSASEDSRCTFGKLKEVPVCFQSPEEYISIFRPLVLEEFKAQLQSSFQEIPSWEEMCFGVLSVLAVERVDDFHLVRFAHDNDDPTSSKSFSENDLVLFTKEHPQKSSHDFHMVGKVERRERDYKRRLTILLIRFYMQNGTSRLNQARRNLLERSKWHASRIMSITPQLREFQALSSIKEIPLLPTILKPINDDGPGSNEISKVDLSKLSQPLQLMLKSSFNDSQLHAISVAIGPRNSRKNVELSLIQGPPGTGKTRTILAIASGLLASPSEKSDQADNFLAGSVRKSSSLSTKISQTAAVARAWQDAALAKQLNEDMQRNSKSSDAYVRRRVLICAQSNAAVDELVSRISSQGLYRSDGKMYKPYLVRVGNLKTVHPNSLPFFIDTLVDHRLADEKIKLNDAKNNENVSSSITLRSNLEKIVDRIRFYEAKRANLSDENIDLKKSLEDDSHKKDDLKVMSDAEVQRKLRKLYEQKKQIYKDLSIAQAQEKKTNEELKGLKYKLRKSILREAEIVVTTLSGCGGDLYAVCSESISGPKFGSPSEHTLFDAVVIDEAAQALEPATLIPLQLLKSNGVKCIMVGDPKQLPATVLSNVASKFLFECSMFERLQKAGHPVVMLTKQYRMHPEICWFPSLHFYERKLLNGEMSSKLAPFHETEALGPYVFYDIVDGRELRGKNSGALSLYNEHEANAATEVVKFFKNRYASEYFAGRIGIITPYKCQLSFLRSRFSNVFGSSIIDEIEFNTVDGFQGREVDILILSTVRAAETNSTGPGINSSNIGFVADVRRMNVALTRAKFSLWIIGNARTLKTNKNWAALIKDASKRNLVRTVKVPYRNMFKGPLQKNSASESYDNPLTELKYNEADNAGQHVKKSKSSKREGKMRTDDIYKGAKSRDNGRGKDFSATRDEMGINKRSGREGLNASVKDSSSLAAICNNKSSEDKKFTTTGEHVANDEFKGKERSEKKFRLENSHKGKRKTKLEDSRENVDHPEQDGGDKVLKAQVPKRHKTFSGGDASRGNQEGSIPSAAISHKERDLNDRGRDSNQAGPSDLIAKRKKQREAVDAILYSALIPSKKSETSAKPLPSKRHSSSSSTPSVGIKPSKNRKD